MRTYEYDQRRWAIDIAQHDRMQRILNTSTAEAVREIALRTIAKIESRYPQHFKKTGQP